MTTQSGQHANLTLPEVGVTGTLPLFFSFVRAFPSEKKSGAYFEPLLLTQPCNGHRLGGVFSL